MGLLGGLWGEELFFYLYCTKHDYLYSAVDDNADRVVLPNDHELKIRISYEYHDVPTSGHPARERTYFFFTRDFYWSHQCEWVWVRMYVRTCEVCQRVKPVPVSQAPLQSLPTPSEYWQSISMDFGFRLPPDNKRRTGFEVFVDHFSKMVAAVPAEVTAKQTAYRFVDMVFRHHGMPIDIVSDRDPRFTARFWQNVFELLGRKLSMSTSGHPQTDGQTECINRVLDDALKCYAHSSRHCSDCLPMAEFAINNSVQASSGHTPFYVNAMRHPRVPSGLGPVAPSLSGGGYPISSKQNEPADTSNIAIESTRARTVRSSINKSTVSTPGVDPLNINEHHTQTGAVVNKDLELNTDFSAKAMDFVQRRQAVIRFVQYVIAASVDRQKLNADNNGRGNTNEFKIGSLVLLVTQNIAKNAVSDFGASKLAPRFIDPSPCWRSTATRTRWTCRPACASTQPFMSVGRSRTRNTSHLVLATRCRRLLEHADARSQDS
ncbi:unnamed protein product [Phytophthora fragariaefolia]|uniref:Unnamed protein product n=1 Tax=Phytophthora fragariaefolia TaxID=1490495 RepID=A0A9W6UF85_9STRA|nr:unnamed protein product [Phytophthora fragariaefolia]